MNRQNLNYNYGYSLNSNNIENPQHGNYNKPSKLQEKTYIGSEKHMYEIQQIKQQFQDIRAHTYTNYARQEVKYYPVLTNDEQFSYQRNNSAKLINSQSQNESTSSFYANKQTRTTTDFKTSPEITDVIVTTSPKSTSNQWCKQKSTRQHRKDEENNLIDMNSEVENYLTWMQEAFGQFQKTGNLKILKDINEKNSAQTLKLFNQIYNEKENITSIINSQSPPKTTAKSQKHIINVPERKQKQQQLKINTKATETTLLKLKQEIFSLQQQSSHILTKLHQQQQQDKQLQEQLIEQIEIKQGHNLDQSRIREENHLKQMQQSVTELEQEVKNLQMKNLDISKNIVQVPFLKEWNLMFQEAKGATKLAIKLRHQIQKKEELIKELTNQDPSNNSDARSVKRMSENGDPPVSKFTKKENRVLNNDPVLIPKPMTPVRPVSQLPFKPSQKLESGRSSTNDVIIRHISHSNRFSQSKKPTVTNSVQRPKQRKQSYDQKQHSYNETTDWKGIPFPANLKNFGVGFIGKDIYNNK